MRGLVSCGSDLEIEEYLLIGDSLTVTKEIHLCSSLWVSSFARLGSTLSVVGLSSFGLISSASIINNVLLGSTLSARSFVRFGSSSSVAAGTSFGSCLTARSYENLGLSLSVSCNAKLVGEVSVYAGSYLENELSFFGKVEFGSTVSTRSSSRLGSLVFFLLDAATLGSSVSVRNSANVGTSLFVQITWRIRL